MRSDVGSQPGYFVSWPALNGRPLINTPLQRGDLALAGGWNPAWRGFHSTRETAEAVGSLERLDTPLKRGVNERARSGILKS